MIVNLKQTEDDHPVQTRLNSPIPQVDGAENEEKDDRFSFPSEYREDDIMDCLEEIFPPQKLATLVSRVQLPSLSGSPDHLCTVILSQVQGKRQTWPVLGPKYVDIFKEIKKI